MLLPATVNAAIYPSSKGVWLVVASRDNPRTAISFAKQLAKRKSNVSVFRSNNGWYAITLGWTRKSTGRPIRNRLVSQGIISGDSYFHSGERFVELIWSTSGVTGRSRSRILAATRLGAVRPSAPIRVDHSSDGPGYVTGLANRSDSYLSFRTGPSTSNRETRRLRKNTRFQIIGARKGWYNVRLTNGRKGWVYGRYVGFGTPNIETAKPDPIPKPATPPKPEYIVSETQNGLKLVVNGLEQAGFGYLSLRKGPGDNYFEMARLKDKTKLIVTGKSGKWYRVKPAPSVEGWVTSEYVKTAEVPTFGPEKETEKVETPKTPETIDIAISKTPTTNSGTATKIFEARGKRVALILGNSAYKHTTALPNPKNDADKISTMLKGLGFQVIVGLDGTKVQMEASIREFVRILPDSKAALLFYAGHAMQVKGSNYLIPIDAKLEDSTAIDFETINLASILNFVDAPGRVSIALLDACRDNPMSRRFARSFGATRSAFLGRGLATPSGTGDLLIGFATAPGEVALDGDGENSPFTLALLKHLPTKGLEIEVMLKRVRNEVSTLTAGSQIPWVSSGLRKEFYFEREAK